MAHAVALVVIAGVLAARVGKGREAQVASPQQDKQRVERGNQHVVPVVELAVAWGPHVRHLKRRNVPGHRA